MGSWQRHREAARASKARSTGQTEARLIFVIPGNDVTVPGGPELWGCWGDRESGQVPTPGSSRRNVSVTEKTRRRSWDGLAGPPTPPTDSSQFSGRCPRPSVVSKAAKHYSAARGSLGCAEKPTSPGAPVAGEQSLTLLVFRGRGRGTTLRHRLHGRWSPRCPWGQ